VKWISHWRCYGFHPEPGTIFEKDCLRYIADFCERETKVQRTTWKKPAFEQREADRRAGE